MSLFNYGECDMCKLHQNSKKNVMMDILPVDICCKVSDFFSCCRCEWMKENEKHFFIYYMGNPDDFTKLEKQLLFFRLYKKPFLSTYQRFNDRDGKKFKKEIDRILDKQSVKNKYKYIKMDLQALKSFCKKDIFDVINVFVSFCYSKKQLDEWVSPSMFRSNLTYTFRNREYKMIDLIKLFLFEYVDDMIGDDDKYCDMDKIKEHINKLFD